MFVLMTFAGQEQSDWSVILESLTGAEDDQLHLKRWLHPLCGLVSADGGLRSLDEGKACLFGLFCCRIFRLRVWSCGFREAGARWTLSECFSAAAGFHTDCSVQWCLGSVGLKEQTQSTLSAHKPAASNMWEDTSPSGFSPWPQISFHPMDHLILKWVSWWRLMETLPPGGRDGELHLDCLMLEDFLISQKSETSVQVLV